MNFWGISLQNTFIYFICQEYNSIKTCESSTVGKTYQINQSIHIESSSLLLIAYITKDHNISCKLCMSIVQIILNPQITAALKVRKCRRPHSKARQVHIAGVTVSIPASMYRDVCRYIYSRNSSLGWQISQGSRPRPACRPILLPRVHLRQPERGVQLFIGPCPPAAAYDSSSSPKTQYTRPTPTRLDSCVASASAVCIGHNSSKWKLKTLIFGQ